MRLLSVPLVAGEFMLGAANITQKGWGILVAYLPSFPLRAGVFEAVFVLIERSVHPAWAGGAGPGGIIISVLLIKIFQWLDDGPKPDWLKGNAQTTSSGILLASLGWGGPAR